MFYCFHRLIALVLELVICIVFYGVALTLTLIYCALSILWGAVYGFIWLRVQRYRLKKYGVEYFIKA